MNKRLYPVGKDIFIDLVSNREYTYNYRKLDANGKPTLMEIIDVKFKEDGDETDRNR